MRAPDCADRLAVAPARVEKRHSRPTCSLLVPYDTALVFGAESRLATSTQLRLQGRARPAFAGREQATTRARALRDRLLLLPLRETAVRRRRARRLCLTGLVEGPFDGIEEQLARLLDGKRLQTKARAGALLLSRNLGAGGSFVDAAPQLIARASAFGEGRLGRVAHEVERDLYRPIRPDVEGMQSGPFVVKSDPG